MKPQEHSKQFALRAFSLTEIAIAMGLVSFVLISLVGLFGVGLQASRESQVDTVESILVRQLLAELKTNGVVPITRTYDPQGGTNATDPFFLCNVTLASPAANSPALSTEAQAKLSRVVIQIAHPAEAPANRRTTNTFHASIHR